MNKKLELTKEQLRVVERYNRAVKDMKDANIICVFKEYDEILAINGEQVEDVFFAEDISESSDNILVKTDEPEVIACPFGLCLTSYDDFSFGVQLK